MNNLKKIFICPGSLIILGLFSFFISSCVKDEINLDKISSTVHVNSGIQVPLAYGELNMVDIINSMDSNKVVRQYEDGLLYILYNKKMSKSASEFVQIPAQTYVETVSAAKLGFVAALPSTPAVNLVDSNYHTFAVSNGEEFDSLVIKSGNLLLNIKSTFRNTGNLIIKAPDLKKNGVSFQITVPITVNDGTFNYNVTPVDLSGYKLKFQKKNGVANKVVIVYSIALNSGGAVTTTYGLTVTTNLENFSFSMIYGYLGSRTLFDESGRFGMKVFDITGEGKIQFKDPKLKILTCNGFGVPFGVTLTDMRTYSEDKNQYVNFTIPTYYKFGSALFSNSKITCDDSTLLFTTLNSNITAAIDIVPNYFYYGIKATTNPDGKAWNFISDTSNFSAEVNVELPLEIVADKYEVSDSMDFDISSALNDFSIIKSLSIYDSIENWFPFEATFQLILTDENYVAIDTLYTYNKQPVIKSGILGADNKIITPGIYSDVVTFTDDRVLKFKNVKKAIIKVAAYTKDYKTKRFVKFYITDKIKFNLGASAEFKINSFDQL